MRTSFVVTLFAGLPPCCVATHVQSATIALSFQGLHQEKGTSTDLAPPDQSGAVGPSDFVEFVNGAFGTFDKVTGAQPVTVTDRQFWLNAGIEAGTLSAGVSNPRILFDPLSERWFAVQITNESQDNHVLLAASKGPSPAPTPGNWVAYSAAGNAAASGGSSSYRYANWPTLGLDATVYTSAPPTGIHRRGATIAAPHFGSYRKVRFWAAAKPVPRK